MADGGLGWEEKVLENAREVWEHGEGIVTFRVFKENNIKQWKAEMTKTYRSLNFPLDKIESIG